MQQGQQKRCTHFKTAAWCSWCERALSHKQFNLCFVMNTTLYFFTFQPNDFSISLKAVYKNKHFKVQLKDGLYCIGQRKFSSMEDLVDHYKKAPIFTSEEGDKLYLIKALTWAYTGTTDSATSNLVIQKLCWLCIGRVWKLLWLNVNVRQLIAYSKYVFALALLQFGIFSQFKCKLQLISGW